MTVSSLGPGGPITNQLYSWVDPQGRGVSPPPEPGEAPGGSLEERTVGDQGDGTQFGGLVPGCCHGDPPHPR